MSFPLWILLTALLSRSDVNQPLPRIEPNDNVSSAGRMASGELRVSLRVGMGTWLPDGAAASAISLAAFGDDGGPLTTPSPMLRAVQGTVVRATVRNSLTVPLTVHGLCDRPGPCPSVTIAAAASREVIFTLGSPGTFHYWATTSGAAAIDARVAGDPDATLGGAIVVDPPGSVASDRVFVLGLWTSPTRDWALINGRSWPSTQRLAHAVGDTVRWRVVNLSRSPHAMHLHGFYYRVNSVGDIANDTIYTEPQRRMVVTEQIGIGGTMTLTWTPERPGNWLFHCHMLIHMMNVRDEAAHAGHTPAAGTDPSSGMAGMVLGVSVTGAARPDTTPDSARRRIRMQIDPDSRQGPVPTFKVNVEGTRQPPWRLSEGTVPGPVMVLTRGEPVAVEIANRLSQPTAIHWHGIELESYDDGVPGFGGGAGSVTPPVAAGGTFTARFTPSRAGTFIYHTHWHDTAQLAGGIYGPLIVLEPGQTFDPSTDHIVTLGLDGKYVELQGEAFAVNGQKPPKPLVLKAGVINRIRLINITADNVALTVQLTSRFDPVEWTLVSKDGAATPPAQRVPRPARQLVTVGETYDYEIAPAVLLSGPLWMELRRGSGELLMQWRLLVK